MKFLTHYVVTVFLGFIFALIFSLMDGFVSALQAAILIALAHFVPSIDWVMKKADLATHFHRGLFHNIFTCFVVFAVFYHFFNPILGLLAFSSILLHIIMDMTVKGHRGVAIFFPISNKRFIIPLFTDEFESALDTISIVGTLLICIYLVI